MSAFLSAITDLARAGFRSARPAAALAAVLLLSGGAQAADITKLPTGQLYDAAGWDGGVLPTTADVGVFDSSTVPTAAGNTFSGSNYYIGGYRVTDIAGPLTINGSTTYIYNGGTVDLSNASADMSFLGTLRSNGPYTGANYTLTVAPGRTLTVNSLTYSRNAYTIPINGGGTILVTTETNGGGTNRVAYDVTDAGTTIGGSGIWRPSNTNGGYGVRMNSGTVVAPGNAGAGTTTFDGSQSGQAILTMASGSTFSFELGTGGSFASPSGDSDRLDFTAMAAGDVVFNSTTIDFLGTGSTGVFKLFDTDLDASTWTGLTMSGQEITAGLGYSNLGGGLTGTLVMGDGTTGDAGDIYLQVVPEPSLLAAVAAAAGSVAVMFRRLR